MANASHHLDRALRDFHGAGVQLAQRATEEEVASFERQYGVILPDDMRWFYLTAGGMEPGSEMWSDAAMSLWALPFVRPIPDEMPEPHYEAYRGIDDADRRFCFADHIIHSDVYAIRLGSDPSAPTPVVSVCGGHGVRASSFTDFVRRCLDDWSSLM